MCIRDRGTVDPFPCRYQTIQFFRDVPWARRCERLHGEPPQRCPRARCMEAIEVPAVLAAVAAVALVTGFDPPGGLFWLYMLLPIAVSIIAEQLRIAAAQTVLDQRGLADAHAVGELPDAEQAAVVDAIVAREVAIVGLAALVIAFRALRGLMTVWATPPGGTAAAGR